MASRENYLKILIKALTDNANSTIAGGMDEDIIVNCGIDIEAKCFKNILAGYTKNITLARLKIEKSTTKNELYPELKLFVEKTNVEIMENKSQNITKDPPEYEPMKVFEPNKIGEGKNYWILFTNNFIH